MIAPVYVLYKLNNLHQNTKDYVKNQDIIVKTAFNDTF